MLFDAPEVTFVNKSASIFVVVVPPRMYALPFRLARSVLQYTEQSGKENTAWRNVVGYICNYGFCVSVLTKDAGKGDSDKRDETYHNEGHEGKRGRPDTSVDRKQHEAL